MNEPTDPQVLEALRRIEIKVDKMDVLLRGPEDGNTPGMTMRLDRIEQKESRRDQIGIGIGVAVVGTMATSLWALLTGGKH